MKVFRIKAGAGIKGLTLSDEKPLLLASDQVRVRVHAVSLNYRDLMVARGIHKATAPTPVIPCSDGAGVVLEVGSNVSRLKPGDRVMSSFFPRWVNGRPTPVKLSDPLGAGRTDGVLAEEVVTMEGAWTLMPSHLDFAHASTLPCAGVTAWNALFGGPPLNAGDNVLLLGTGGVSIFALQLARASGINVIITSSSDTKLERAAAMGAAHVINYATCVDWEQHVLKLTGGVGADVIVEVGGKGTMKRSLACAAFGGNVAVIGGVSGFGGTLEPHSLIGKSLRLTGVHVGSRQMLEDLAKLMFETSTTPIIDQTFSFDRAVEAYQYLDAGHHFGKVVIRMND